MNYIAHGRYEDHPSFALRARPELAEGTGSDRDVKQRGIWLDHNGQTMSHEESLHWAKEKVHQELGNDEIFFWSEIARKILLSDKPTNGMFVDEEWSF